MGTKPAAFNPSAFMSHGRLRPRDSQNHSRRAPRPRGDGCGCHRSARVRQWRAQKAKRVRHLSRHSCTSKALRTSQRRTHLAEATGASKHGLQCETGFDRCSLNSGTSAAQLHLAHWRVGGPYDAARNVAAGFSGQSAQGSWHDTRTSRRSREPSAISRAKGILWPRGRPYQRQDVQEGRAE
jgi:hypothetical protein